MYLNTFVHWLFSTTNKKITVRRSYSSLIDPVLFFLLKDFWISRKSLAFICFILFHNRTCGGVMFHSIINLFNKFSCFLFLPLFSYFGVIGLILCIMWEIDIWLFQSFCYLFVKRMISPFSLIYLLFLLVFMNLRYSIQ